MGEPPWDDLEGRTVRYAGDLWELTGKVEVLDSGELLALSARREDDVRGESAKLHFAVEGAPHSLNPGDLGEQFDHIERTGDGHHLVVRTDGRTYRYGLEHLQHD